MKVIILFMAGLLAGSAASCTRDNEEDAYEKSSIVKVGDEIPDFSVTNETGTVGKGDLAGKKTLLVLFSSACEDCRVVLPVLEAAWKALRSDPVVIVLLISRWETAADVASYWEKVGLTIPYFLDPGREVFNKFAKAYTPRVYLIDGQPQVVEMYIESLKISGEELYGKVSAL